MASAAVHSAEPHPRRAVRARAARAARGGDARLSPPKRRDVLFGFGTLAGSGRSLASPPSSRAETGGARLPETRLAVSGAVSSRPGPEFESVVFPRYPGFVTLASGVQVRDLCVPEDEDGNGEKDAKKKTRDDAFVKPGDEVVVEYGLWTVHQGRNVVPPPVVGSAHAHETFAFTVTGGDATGEKLRAKKMDGGATRWTAIPALDEAVRAGMRLGGVRRVLVVPKASISYRYVPVDAAVTKYGRAPTQDPKFGVQVPNPFDATLVDDDFSRNHPEGPYPPRFEDDASGSRGAAWLEYVVKTNAFTIKPTDRSLLFDVRLVAVNGVSIGRGGGDGDGDVSGAAGVGVALRRATSRDQVGPVNDASEDGGASFWTFALPKPGEYVVQP
jgi:hypothetical protein